MKPLLINTSTSGGAAKACIRLHNVLLSSDIDSNLLVRHKNHQIDNTTDLQEPLESFSQKVSSVLQRKAAEKGLIKNKTQQENTFKSQRPKGLELFSYPHSNFDITTHSLYQQADIVNLHWVANFLDWKSFFLKNKKNVVWTLHDQNPFLGGQHYDERYLGIDDQGSPINRIKTKLEIEEDQRLLNFKMSVLKDVDNLHVVAPSRWLFQSSQQSQLFGRFPHYHIPNGFPTNTFRPYDRQFCRDILEIPDGKTVVLFVADSITNNRKGYIYLKRAIEKLQNDNHNNLYLCSIGNKSDQKSTINDLGRINDEKLMAIAYNAADVFVIPSLEDNLPSTMIESTLCGTPVIGFDNGGIKDVVIDGQTGYLCQETSVDGLYNSILKFLNDPNTLDRTYIAENAKSLYDQKIQAERYTQLYQDILSKS